MVFDSFQFFNELDLLRLRMGVMDPVVDRFVVSESTVTFSGDSKPLYFHENKDLFKAYAHKIIHNIVQDTPDVDPFQRDSFQKCAVIRGLAGCKADDVIIFSDVDEIPNPEKIRVTLAAFQADKIYHFAQRMFYYYLNLEEVSGKLMSFTGEFEEAKPRQWLGTKMCAYSILSGSTLEQLRFPESKDRGIRVANGGWHFSYMGGDKTVSVAKRVEQKIKSAAHQEFNSEKILSRIQGNIRRQKDLFGRESKFVRTDIDGSFPDFLVRNQDSFSHLILPKPKKANWFPYFRK